MKLSLFGFLFILSSQIFAQTEIKGDPEDLRIFLHPDDNIVVIQGYAERTAFSDRAIVSLVFTTEDKLLSNAMSKNTDLRSTIRTTLVNAGVSDDSIKNSKFSSSPQYGWFGRKPDSYKVVNRMSITITDEKQLEEIAVVSDQYEEADLASTQFEHSEKDEFNNHVKQDALANIMAQKAFYEELLDIKLIAVGFRDSNINRVATAGAYEIEEIVVTARKREGSLQEASISTNTQSEASFDELKYSANLSVNFRVETGEGHR